MQLYGMSKVMFSSCFSLTLEVSNNPRFNLQGPLPDWCDLDFDGGLTVPQSIPKVFKVGCCVTPSRMMTSSAWLLDEGDTCDPSGSHTEPDMRVESASWQVAVLWEFTVFLRSAVQLTAWIECSRNNVYIVILIMINDDDNDNDKW